MEIISRNTVLPLIYGTWRGKAMVGGGSKDELHTLPTLTGWVVPPELEGGWVPKKKRIRIAPPDQASKPEDS